MSIACCGVRATPWSRPLSLAIIMSSIAWAIAPAFTRSGTASHRRAHWPARADVPHLPCAEGDRPSSLSAASTALVSCSGSASSLETTASTGRSPARSRSAFSLVIHSPRSASTACAACAAADSGAEADPDRARGGELGHRGRARPGHHRDRQRPMPARRTDRGIRVRDLERVRKLSAPFSQALRAARA